MNNNVLESLISDVAVRFGLSAEKARQLTSALISLIFDENRGGFAGFTNLFRRAGLGDVVQSWIGTGPNLAISPTQVDSVLGSGLIGAIAQKLGIGGSVASAAISGLLPGVVNELTPDGREPHHLPDSLAGWINAGTDWVAELGRYGWGAVTAAGAAIAGGARAVGNAADRGVDAATDAARSAGGGLGKLLPWLLLAALLIGAFFLFKGCKKEEAVTPPVTETTPASTPAAPVAQANSRFDFANDNGAVTVSGQVPSDADKTRLLDAIKATFGADKVNGDITVDANTVPAGWLDKLTGLLPELKANGLKLGFDGDKINIDTSALPEAERLALSQKLRGAFGGYEVSGLWDKALAAFAGLKAGFSADDLVKALNLSAIYFDTGKASITRDSNETLIKAAEAIKAAPAGTRIEIGGHTDNTGDAAANLTLSQQRADAVKARLVELGVAGDGLSTKGYGQTQPVGDNNTEEGKALNRRIAFTLQK